MEIRLRVLLLTLLATGTSGCATLSHLLPHHRTPQPTDAGQPGGDAAGDAGGTGAAPAGAGSTASGQGGPSGEGSTAPAGQGGSEDAGSPPRVIEPQVQRRRIRVPHIGSEDIELGGYLGTLNIEDFGAHEVYGVQAAWHITEDFFFQAEAGRSKGGVSSFEKLSNVSLLTDSERWFKYYDLSLGYNFLPGEVFIGRNHAMVTSFYVLAGVGGTDFGGETNFTVNFGAGYKILPTDWLAVHVAVEDRVLNSDILGVSKLASNLEAHLGLTVFF